MSNERPDYSQRISEIIAGYWKAMETGNAAAEQEV
jgi:hypothetical protein